jgi:hypothetical protein
VSHTAVIVLADHPSSVIDLKYGSQELMSKAERQYTG